MRSTPTLTALAIAVTLGACDAGGTIGTVARTTADVVVVNASTTGIDLLQDQALDPGNSGIAFGGASLCMTVDIISHGLSVRPSGLHTSSAVLPSFAANEKYAVVVTGNGNSLQPVSFRNSFAVPSAKAAVRLVNVSGTGPYDIFVTDSAAALSVPSAANVGSGVASSYFAVVTTKQQIRLTTTGSTLVAFDVGTVTLAAGSRAMVVLAPPAAGSSTPRAFVFQQLSTASC